MSATVDHTALNVRTTNINTQAGSMHSEATSNQSTNRQKLNASAPRTKTLKGRDNTPARRSADAVRP
eukprot:6207102-Pleurochrysis_carterae.AAC.1